HTRREWLWLAVSVAASATWLNQAGGFAGPVTPAGAGLFGGDILAPTVWRPSGKFSRVLGTTAIAGVTLVIWMWHLGLGWDEVQRAVERDLWTYNQEVLTRLGEVGQTYPDGFLNQMADMIRTIGAFYPALFALACI